MIEPELVSNIEKRYFKDGVLQQFPAKRGKQLAALYIIGQKLPKGATFSELEINEEIKRLIACRDHNTVRRDLVDAGFLKRTDNGSEYWVD